MTPRDDQDERIATLETHYKHLSEDVAEIKSDVKTLLESRGNAGGAVSLVRLLLPFGALLLSTVAIVVTIQGCL